ncbi:DNA gyrase subunit A [Candidatus Microgenomates bacterium]|nr:MAG: DNA gyrase subunit A [Candidatus Microgenomates bacterium]
MVHIGKLLQTEIVDAMQRSYLDYAMSVIVARALPDVRDGLKPVHRRILYVMYQKGLLPPSRYTKTANVVGEVLGKYHPHGDSAIYDALVRLAQDFSMRYKLIDGQGNFGSIDGDPPAAMRYTECRLAAISAEMLADIDKETVSLADNYDGTLQEPEFLPAKLPNLLLMGAEGIAVGMATKIPPHNLGELIDAVNFMIQKGSMKAKEIEGEAKKADQKPSDQVFSSTATVDELMQFVKGPDFPTRGAIFDAKEIQAVYQTGKGRIVMRGKAEIEDIGQGKSAIIITELPYQVNKAHLVSHIAHLAKDKKLDGITDLRDESDRRGIRVVVELKRDAKPKSVLNNLFKHTSLQTTFPVNIVALVDGTPRTLSLKIILEEYVKHRLVVIRRRSEYELRKAKERAHILEGLLIAVNNIDAVIETIKKSKDVDTARTNLMNKFKLTEIQATAILDMQLRRLAALERQKLEEEYKMLKETIDYLEDLLAHPIKMLKIITEELNKIKEKYADERKTKVYKSKVDDFSEEDLIANEETIITLTKTGYIKRLSRMTFKTQSRGGKGVIGMTTKEEDTVEMMSTAMTHDNVLFFSDRGKVYQIKVWDIPEVSRQSKGQAVVNLINIEQGERITSVLTYDEKSRSGAKFIIMTTIHGVIKKTAVSQFEKIRRNGLVAIKLESGDQLSWAALTSGKDEILLVSHHGKSIRFNEAEVRSTARDTMGVRGILLKNDDRVVSMDIITEENKGNHFLTIMERGLGKKSAISSFPRQKRGGQGVKVAEITTRTGNVIVSRFMPSDCESVILTSVKGQVVKLPIKSIPLLTRATQGVILMRFADKSDSIAAATCV